MRDYSARLDPTPPKRSRGGLIAALVVVVALGAAGWYLIGGDDSGTTAPATGRIVIPLQLPPATSSAAPGDPAPVADARQWTEFTVASGDNLAALFQRAGVSARTLHEIMELGRETREMANLHPGQTVRLGTVEDGRLERLEVLPDPIITLAAQRADDGWRFERIEQDVERRRTWVSETIDSSLFDAGQRAGLSDGLIMQLADVFGWDIDFAQELRAGDTFTVVYDELYMDGERLREGDLIAAEFVNQGRVLRALRFTDSRGRSSYYQPDGKRMQKAFLRNPIDIVRITSGFSLGRKHPILNKIRAHKGVDYAAATGTPVRAAGDGTIEFRGTKGGYGRTVEIKHANGRSTLYAHLSRYGKGSAKGERVRQGQIIGHVGQSGLATGPHLHYEFRVNGSHVNPQRVKLPSAEPIAPEYREAFEAESAPLLAQLDLLGRTLFASAAP